MLPLELVWQWVPTVSAAPELPGEWGGSVGTRKQVSWERDKREKERARNGKMKGLVAPWQQLCGFPWEPQAGTGMFLGHAEVRSALLAQPPWAGTLPSPVCTFPNQALSLTEA